MAINNNIEDPKYRKKIYDFLSTNFADFKRTETDFYKKLDTDSNYAGQVYDVISQNYSDFGRPRAEFLELMLPSKKKELSEVVSPVGGEVGISAPPSDSGKGFGELKPAKRQPAEVIKEPKVVGEDTLLTRKMEREQRPVISTTGVRLPAAPKLVAEEKAAERALAPKLETRVAKDEQGWLANTVSALDRGFYKNLIGNPIKGLATVVQYGTEAMTGGRVKEGPVSDALNKLGDWFNNAIDEIAPQDPEFKNSLTDQFTQALGQVGSIVFTGGLGAGGRAAGIATQAVPSAGRLAPAVAAGKELVSEITSPAAISAGLTMGQAEFDRAKKAGASDDQAFEAFYKNAAVGSILEKIPVMQFFKRFNNATAGGVANYIKNKGVAGITGGLEEATTEVLQQVYANKTAKDIYNTNQDIFEGLTESGGIGFGVGFLLNAMGANAKLLRKQGKEAEAQLVDAQIKEFESRAEKGPEVPPAPAVAPEMAQYTMEAPRLPGEPEQISKPIELSVEPQVPAAPAKVEPIRQLGTGANVYFENENYRVNDFRDKVLLNVQGIGDTGVIANLEFDTPREAVEVAKTLNRLYPQGIPEAVLLDKVVEDIKAGKYKEVAKEVATEVPAAPAKAPITTIEVEEAARQMQPITDRMVQIEREFENLGYKIDTDYDNEMIVSDIEGNEVGEIPESLVPLAAEYEKATRRLGEFDDRARERALSKSREVVEAEAVEVKPELPAAPVAILKKPSERKNGLSWKLFDGKKEVGSVVVSKKEGQGFRIANVVIAEDSQKKGIATKAYIELNDKSIEETGLPLSSGLSLNEKSEKLWSSLVKKGLAEKLENGQYQFVSKITPQVPAAPEEEVSDRKFWDEYGKSDYSYGQYGGKSSDTLYIRDRKSGKVVKEIKIKNKDFEGAKKEVFKWIDSKSGTKILEAYEEVYGKEEKIEKPELPAAPEKTQDEVAKEQTKETDLLLGGQAEQRRKDGKYTKDGVEYVRNPKGQGIASEMTGEVRFTNEVSLPFKYKLVEAETLQPSHQDGIRNPLHFIPEAQPKNRNDVGSLQAEESFANNPRFSELGENTNAYSGAPVVNERGEVVQGNNRSAGLRKGYQRNNPQYKNDLAANAEQFGFTREQVEGMKSPILVREIEVNDQGAVELGNYDVKDLETGGKRRIDPIAVTRRMPFDVKGRIADLFTGEETLNQAIRANQKRLLELLNPYLNQAQRNTITKDGVLTDAGIKDLEAVVQQFLFDNGDTALPDLFESLSATQKEGLRKSLPYVFSVSPEKSLVPDIQEAILAVNDFNASGAGEFDAWLLQGDIFNDGKTPKDKYTPLELAIAKTLVESKTQKEVARKFADYADVVKDKEADMFEPARPGKSRKEGVLEIFKAEDYAKPISERGRKEAAPEKKPTPEPSAEKRARETKREPRLPETEKRAEARKELRDAFNDLMNLGVAYDPRSQAEKQVRLTKAIINVIKQEAIVAIKELQKYIKDNLGFDISDVDAKYLLIESKKPEYAIQEPTAGKVPVQPKARAGEEVEAGVPPARPPKAPEKGEVEGETAAEKKSVELSLKGIKEIANEFSIEDVEGITRKTDIELRENAKDKIDKWVAEGSYDKNIDNLVKKAEEFDVLTDEQRIILEQHLANVRENFSNGIENGTIKAGSEEFTNGLNQIKRLLDAASKTRSAAGAALRIPIGGSVAHPLENYDTALVAKMDANSVDKLTDAQIKEVEESVRLYKEKIDAANERIKDLEDKLSQMMAEEEVGSVKKRKKAIKSKEERVAERKQAIADAREALKKIRTGEAGLSAVPIPFVREFVAISPYVKKIAQSYIEEGVDNLNLLIDKIYEDFKDDLPEMTKKDVRDIIGNQYSQRKETATEAKSKLRDLTEEARLLSLYEKLLSGEEPVSERKKIERNQRIVELRNKINEIRKRNKEQDVDYKDLKRIEDTKNRALQKAKEYKKRLDEKDFAPSEKPISIFNDTKLQKKYPKEYNEMLDAIQEREDAKHEFDIELMKDEERRQTKLQKIGRYAKMFTGTTKAIKSGIDASATLIQNFAMLSAYPKSFAKAFVNQWGDFASQKKFNRWHTAIKNNKPVWDLIQNSGLSITEPSALKEAQKEEIFSDNLLDRTFKIGDKTYNIGKYTTKPFERLFVSMGNALRVDVFLRIADKWYVEGKTFETNPEDYKSLANMLNNMTSRAKLAPAVERARDIVGTGIWSPQLMASRLNLLGISDVTMPFFGRKGYYAGLTPKVRKMQVANMAKMIGLGLSIMLLAKVSGSDDDEGDLDPVSPTFGTVKIGEKRIPVWSNYPKYIRTIAQFASGKQKIEGEYADKRRGETAQRFFRSSVPPATGTAIDIITGRDYMGKPITKEGIVKGLVMPMSLEAISKEVQRDGVLGAVTGAAQFFGLNVSDERDYVKKDDRPFDIKDPVTFKKREVTEKELEAFKKRRDEIYKELVDDYENGRKTIYLNPEDKIKLSIPSSVSDMELDSWRELYYEKLTPEQIKELYKLLMSKAKKDSKNELKLTLGEEEEKED